MNRSKVQSIIIFGSSARGESDIYSDLDVCAISREELNDLELSRLKKEISVAYNLDPEEITVYSSQQIENMVQYGSLFLWHLKLEGNVIFDDGYFHSTMNRLAKYDKHLSELVYHSELLKDVQTSFELFSIVNELDLSQLFTICRNTCMILSHYNKKFSFGRKSAFTAAISLYPELPIKKEEYDYLSQWKLRYERGLFENIKLPPVDEVQNLINTTKMLLYFAIGKVSGENYTN